MAGLALGDIHLRFARQAWHLATLTFVLRGRHCSWRHPPSFCVAGLAVTGIMSHTHILVTHTHTQLCHTLLCHTPSFTFNFVTHYLSHTTFTSHSHASLCHTQLCHTHLSVTHSFVTHHLSHAIFVTHHLSHTSLSHTIFTQTTLSHTIFHIQLCLTPSCAHNVVTHHLSHTSLSHRHNFVTHTTLSHPSFTHNLVIHHLCHTPSSTH